MRKWVFVVILGILAERPISAQPLNDLIDYFQKSIFDHQYSRAQFLAFTKPYAKWDVRPLRARFVVVPGTSDTMGPTQVPNLVWGAIAHGSFGLSIEAAQKVPNEFLKEGFVNRDLYCTDFYPSHRAVFSTLVKIAPMSQCSIFIQQKNLRHGGGYERVDSIFRESGTYWRYITPRGSPFQVSPQIDTLHGYKYPRIDEIILSGLDDADCYCMVKVREYLIFMTGGLLDNSIGFIYAKKKPKADSLRPLFNLAMVEDVGDGFYFYMSH